MVYVVYTTWAHDLETDSEINGVFAEESSALQCLNDIIETEKREGFSSWWFNSDEFYVEETPISLQMWNKERPTEENLFVYVVKKDVR